MNTKYHTKVAEEYKKPHERIRAVAEFWGRKNEYTMHHERIRTVAEDYTIPNERIRAGAELSFWLF